MKRIRNGVIFDTDKAEEICTWVNGFNCGDFEWIMETLYRSENKKMFFIVGEGGAKTEYSRPLGNNSVSGGSRLWEVSEKEALVWMEEKDCEMTDEVTSFFESLIK